MAERPEDLNLPITVVQRIIKEALPDGVVVSKEARQTISRASSVFVLYLTACAVTHANKGKRKTLAINDIFTALEDMEFDSFLVPLKEALKSRKEAVPTASKRTNLNNSQNNVNSVTTTSKQTNGEDDDVAEDVDEDEEVVEADEEMEDENEDPQSNTKKMKLMANGGTAEDHDDLEEDLEDDVQRKTYETDEDEIEDDDGDADEDEDDEEVIE